MEINEFQTTVHLIANLQQVIKDEIMRRQKHVNSNHAISIQALHNISDRLKKIESILSIQRYNLVFIGQVGVGKTTAICHLFGLIREVANSRSVETNSSKSKKRNKFKELLSTGSGKTTICEVVIRAAGYTNIEIEPYAKKELQQIIEEFSLWIWQKQYSQVVKEKVEIPPDELLRAIRNIVQLPELVINGKIVDQALEFAARFSSNQYQEFKMQMIDRGQLDNRNEVKIYPEVNCEDRKLWVSTTFQSLNVASLANFSIPKRIYINLDSELLDFNNHPRLGSIIDTRGLDLLTKDRRDLACYIRENDNSICIFTEKFASAPGNIMPIISKYLTTTSVDIDTKCAVIVMHRKGEPEKVVDASGQAVDDMVEGIALRKANIENVFAGEAVNLSTNNIVFYDALSSYLDDCTINPCCDLSDINAEKEYILTKIEEIIIDREQKLQQEIVVLSEQVANIAAAIHLTPLEDSIVASIKQKIYSLSELNIDECNFADSYIKMLPDNASVLRATNNRYGQYDLRDIDIYFNGRSLTEGLVRWHTRQFKVEILQEVEYVGSEIDIDSSLYPMLNRLRHQIDENYEVLVVDLGEKIETLLANQILAPQDYDDSIFWQKVISRWGQGSGYKSDVLSVYNQQVESIDANFSSEIRTAWREQIIQPILIFLGEKNRYMIQQSAELN
jgi:GTPase SAR1 family protein